MAVNRKSLLLYLILIIILGCSSPRLTETTQSPIKIFFSPQVDLNHKLAEYIDNANESIRGCFYSIDSKEVAYSLIKARLRGVKVQIVMDESRLFEEDSFYSKLKNFGIAKKDTATKGLMHNKFCVIDEKLVWTGSYNPSAYAVYTNNDAIVIESEELADIYLQEFYKLWGAQITTEDRKRNNKIEIHEDLKVEVYFSPEEGSAILERLLELLEGAKTSIYFAQFTITHPDIAKILIKKAGKGIDVQGVMEYEQIGAYSQYPNFEIMRMDVRKDKNYCFNLHHKFFIIDGKIVITGSLNPTHAGLNTNRENILIIYSTEAAQEYLRYFENIR